MKSAISYDDEYEYNVSCGSRAFPNLREASRRALVTVSGLVFDCSALATVLWFNSMSAMRGMSMTWMRMPGQSWFEATAWFLAMWVVMMAAMMTPSLTPMLWRYQQAIRCSSESRQARLTVIAGLGYFFVWTLFGLAVFPLGVLLATAAMELPVLARAVPIAVGVVILISGVVQLSSWKADHLGRCRDTPRRGRLLRASAGAAWRHGLRIGLHCGISCANLTASFW